MEPRLDLAKKEAAKGKNSAQDPTLQDHDSVMCLSVQEDDCHSRMVRAVVWESDTDQDGGSEDARYLLVIHLSWRLRRK
jgi:hypothetical protein